MSGRNWYLGFVAECRPCRHWSMLSKSSLFLNEAFASHGRPVCSTRSWHSLLSCRSWYCAQSSDASLGALVILLVGDPQASRGHVRNLLGPDRVFALDPELHVLGVALREHADRAWRRAHDDVVDARRHVQLLQVLLDHAQHAAVVRLATAHL